MFDFTYFHAIFVVNFSLMSVCAAPTCRSSYYVDVEVKLYLWMLKERILAVAFDDIKCKLGEKYILLLDKLKLERNHHFKTSK